MQPPSRKRDPSECRDGHISYGQSWSALLTMTGRGADGDARQQERTMMADRLGGIEASVRDILNVLGQSENATNDRLVNQIARKIMRALPVWTHPDSPLRRRSP